MFWSPPCFGQSHGKLQGDLFENKEIILMTLRLSHPTVGCLIHFMHLINARNIDRIKRIYRKSHLFHLPGQNLTAWRDLKCKFRRYLGLFLKQTP